MRATHLLTHSLQQAPLLLQEGTVVTCKGPARLGTTLLPLTPQEDPPYPVEGPKPPDWLQPRQQSPWARAFPDQGLWLQWGRQLSWAVPQCQIWGCLSSCPSSRALCGTPIHHGPREEG